jgi:pimeloyl-ACP methyl ester carboxylesterase
LRSIQTRSIPGRSSLWIGAYASQHPGARTNYITRTQDEDALKGAAGKVPVLVLLGKEDKFILPDPVEKLFKETFTDVEVQIWPEVGHIPFFEEPEKTRNAILAFVNRVNKVRLSRLSSIFPVSHIPLTGLKNTVDHVKL